MTTRLLVHALSALLGSTVLVPRTAEAQSAPDCDAVELVQGNDAYNELVCRGIRSMATGQHPNAVRDFERALAVDLFEYPNFALFPRLAMAYWRAGRAPEATAALEKARLSLHVLVGIYRCRERQPDSKWVLVTVAGDAVSHEFADEITARMCGAAYSDMYTFDESRPLESFAKNGKLVSHYLHIREIIGGRR